MPTNIRNKSKRIEPQAAFTLVEILAAMAILVVVVLGLSRAFNEAAGIFRRGTTMAERNSTVQLALERIAKDLEGLIVNERLALYEIANADVPTLFGFDRMYFASSARDVLEGTSRDTDHDAAYHFVRYQVEVVTQKFAGVEYYKFRLNRSAWMRDLFALHNMDPARTDLQQRRWWEDFDTDDPVQPDTEALLENVVRFDIYVHNENGELITRWTGITGYVDTTVTKPPEYPVANVMPAMIDIYVQVTSEDSMRRAGMILAKNPSADLRNEAAAQLVRDSNVMILRVFPLLKTHQWLRVPEMWDGKPLWE